MSWFTQNSPWYVQRSGKMHGPFKPRKIVQLAVARKLRPHDLVWTVGLPDWRAAGDLEGLYAPPLLTRDNLTISPDDVTGEESARVSGKERAAGDDASPDRSARSPSDRSAEAADEPDVDGPRPQRKTSTGSVDFACERPRRRRVTRVIAGLSVVVAAAAIGVAFSLDWDAKLGGLGLGSTFSWPIDWSSERSAKRGDPPGKTENARPVRTSHGEPPDMLMELMTSPPLGGVAAAPSPRLVPESAQSEIARNSAAIWERVHPSMVRVLAFGENQIPRRLGLGFYFKANLVATSLHVVANAKSLALENIERRDVTRAARIKAISREFNIAIIETERSAAPLPLSQPGLQKIGDPVLVFGDPSWSSRSSVAGTITGERSLGAKNIFEISAELSPGRSGGPVFDEQGNVLGVAIFEIAKSQQKNFAMSVAVLTDLADQNLTSAPDFGLGMGIDVQQAISIENYEKREGESSEEITLKNISDQPIENIILAIAYRDAKGKIFNAKLLRMEGPVNPGMVRSQDYVPPNSIWPMTYDKFNPIQGGGFRVDIWPLDFEYSNRF